MVDAAQLQVELLHEIVDDHEGATVADRLLHRLLTDVLCGDAEFHLQRLESMMNWIEFVTREEHHEVAFVLRVERELLTQILDAGVVEILTASRATKGHSATIACADEGLEKLPKFGGFV